MYGTALQMNLACTQCGQPMITYHAPIMSTEEQFITLFVPPCKRCVVPMYVAKDWGFHE